MAGEQWVMKFNGFSTANSGGAGVYCNDEETIALSFKLEFPCSNNTTEYKAYLMGLAMALKMGIKHLRVIGNSNLVIYQAKEVFPLKNSIWLCIGCWPKGWRKIFVYSK